MRRLLACGLVLWSLSGCTAPAAPASQEVSIRSSTTAGAAVRIGPFIPGERGVKDDRVLQVNYLPPEAEWTLRLPTGRYTIEGRIDATYTSSFFEVSAGRATRLTLTERMTPYQASPADKPSNVRSLTWEE